MSKWPQSANLSWELVSGSPLCALCDRPAERLVSTMWSRGIRFEHPACERHLQMYRADFDRFAVEIKRALRASGEEAA